MENEGVVLERSISLAANAHAGQLRLNGEPYILHLIRVMLKVDSIDAKVVAMLHDVVEDTDITLYDLDNLWDFPSHTVDAIALLTRKKNVEYKNYIRNILESNNELAIEVKLADLRDNMDDNNGHYPDLYERHSWAYNLLRGSVTGIT